MGITSYKLNLFVVDVCCGMFCADVFDAFGWLCVCVTSWINDIVSRTSVYFRSVCNELNNCACMLSEITYDNMTECVYGIEIS